MPSVIGQYATKSLQQQNRLFVEKHTELYARSLEKRQALSAQKWGTLNI